MPQLTLFPALPKPRIPKAVVVQAGTLRNAIKGRREVRYWRWMQRVAKTGTVGGRLPEINPMPTT